MIKWSNNESIFKPLLKQLISTDWNYHVVTIPKERIAYFGTEALDYEQLNIIILNSKLCKEEQLKLDELLSKLDSKDTYNICCRLQ